MGRSNDRDQAVAAAPAEEAAAAHWLMQPMAVSQRCQAIYLAGCAGELEHFRVAPSRVAEAARYVAGVITERHGERPIAPHARWRHFTVAGHDLWRELAAGLEASAEETARIRFDLAVTSVLLDAGAGPHWRYRHEPTGEVLARSEGLAIASFEAFRRGVFSSDPYRPLMADAAGLTALSEDDLARAFQVSDTNPLPGLAGRVDLLRRLGAALDARFAAAAPDSRRPAAIFDALQRTHRSGTVRVLDLFTELQQLVGPIWPDRLRLAGLNLGDTWRHPHAGGAGPSAGLVPFHKLVQWMCYSLIEVVEDAGLRFADKTVLTPLAEYRNGGLLVDLGVIAPRQAAVLECEHAPGDQLVVEWRALTVTLITAIAGEVRRLRGASEDELPLAAVLEGGTWWAGRKIAAELRPGGGPPIRVVSDGTVF